MRSRGHTPNQPSRVLNYGAPATVTKPKSPVIRLGRLGKPGADLQSDTHQQAELTMFSSSQVQQPGPAAKMEELPPPPSAHTPGTGRCCAQTVSEAFYQLKEEMEQEAVFNQAAGG